MARESRGAKSCTKRPRRRWGWLAVALGLALAAAAQADWLVTREGAKVETTGPWKVRGKLVVFERVGGELSSLRLDEVDLPASEAATRQAVEDKKKAEEEKLAPPEVVAKPRRKPIRVITDKDFPQAKPEGEAVETAPGAAPTEAEPSTTGPLQVIDWDRVESSDFRGVELAGKVRNTSTETLTSIELEANLFDETQNLVGRAPAELSVAALPPGETADFIVRVAGAYSYKEVRFLARSRGFAAQATPKGEDAPP